MSLSWNQNQVQEYLRGWSAVQKYIKTNERDPAVALTDKLKLAWGNEPIKTISWPLVRVFCRKCPLRGATALVLLCGQTIMGSEEY
jgi:hypothetical protein